MADPTFDMEAANNWFAREFNNATWAWLDANTQGVCTDPIVHVAHASYHHWNQIGTTINQARAASLVANVHAAVGNGELAKAFAHECFELLESAGEEAQDWDVAFAHDSLARALTALGDVGSTAQWLLAGQHGEIIADPGDKAVFDAWFAKQPESNQNQ